MKIKSLLFPVFLIITTYILGQIWLFSLSFILLIFSSIFFGTSNLNLPAFLIIGLIYYLIPEYLTLRLVKRLGLNSDKKIRLYLLIVFLVLTLEFLPLYLIWSIFTSI